MGDLNAEQRRAMEASDRPVLIVAGSGTGKTKTLTARIAYLLSEKRVAPTELVALTFTAKAAGEMRERLATLLDGRIALPKVATFHALCQDLLQKYGRDRRLITELERRAHRRAQRRAQGTLF